MKRLVQVLRWRLAGIMLLLGAADVFGARGVVLTRSTRLEGDLAMQAATIQVGTNVVPWSSVLYVLFDPEVRTFPPSHRAQCVHGEEWLGEIVALSAAQLTFRFALFGTCKVAGTNLAFIDFSPNVPRPTLKNPGTLYLREGEPLSGTLVWIDANQLAIDSPLGVLTLPRERVLRYVFPAHDPRQVKGAAGDEVRLVDGTILQGWMRFETNQVTLRHPSLGELTIPAGVIRSISKSSPGTARLADLRPDSVPSQGLFASSPGEGHVICERQDEPQSTRQDFLTSMTIGPKTTLRYRLGDEFTNGTTFRALFGAAPQGRGSARITLLAGTNSLLEREFKGGEAPGPVTVPVPATRELTLQVDFGSRIGFPCGVTLADAFLLTNPDKPNP